MIWTDTEFKIFPVKLLYGYLFIQTETVFHRDQNACADVCIPTPDHQPVYQLSADPAPAHKPVVQSHPGHLNFTDLRLSIPQYIFCFQSNTPCRSLCGRGLFHSLC